MMLDNSLTQGQMWKLHQAVNKYLLRKRTETGRDEKELLEELQEQIRHEQENMTEEQEEEALRDMRKWLDTLPAAENDDAESSPFVDTSFFMDAPDREAYDNEKYAYRYEEGYEESDIDPDIDNDDDTDSSGRWNRSLNVYKIDIKNLRQFQTVSEINKIIKESVRGENISAAIKNVEEDTEYGNKLTAVVMEIIGDSIKITDPPLFRLAISMADDTRFEILGDRRIRLKIYVNDTKNIATVTMFDGAEEYGEPPF